jgi:hypothetical protein
MSAPAKRPRPRELREGETLVIRQAGDPVKFRRLAAKVRARRARLKPVSVVRELAQSRLRGAR